jgi:hypothetical protein
MTGEPELFGQPPPSLWDRIWDAESEPTYWLTRFAILRLLGLVYFAAFLSFVDQSPGLLGTHGLTPVGDYLDRAESALGSRTQGFLRLPTIFWLDSSDRFLARVGWVGVFVSLAVLLGYANAVNLSLLWFLYLSIVQVGQDWYQFGWEIQLLETGFLAIFLCPLLDGRPFPRRPAPPIPIWLFRFLIFRIMLGAGLIKLRGDDCWRELTCLAFHYETQPIPNPFSHVLHFMPLWFHKLGVLFNDLCELVAPFFVFGPARLRRIAGLLLVSFQVMLIVSGNLAFLNWLTIVPALACFDDSFWRRVLPRGIVEPAVKARGAGFHGFQQVAATALLIVVALLAIYPLVNLLSPSQAMNASFDRLHLVNTYGAFGSVGRERAELVFEGTEDPVPGEGARWKEYEFPCKPTGLERRPCVISPYHYRLDWLLWFAAMDRPEQYPWTLHLVWKLLENDPVTLQLVKENPFVETPPRFVRVELYRYRFAPPGSAGYWTREKISPWLPPLSRDDARFREFLRSQNWLE